MDRPLRVVDLGRLGYDRALDRQRAEHARVLAAREAGSPEPGVLLLVEHDPVITVSRRRGAADHLLATPEALARARVEVRPTDRGGDVTYHGPGQLVAYPILDLNALGLRLIDHVRLLEQSVIDALARFGVHAVRDPGASGVWLPDDRGQAERKIAAVGVRVQRWISLHGVALNVTTDLDHFAFIVPCGLAGRPVTTLARELGAHAPAMDEVRRALVEAMQGLVARRLGAGAGHSSEG